MILAYVITIMDIHISTKHSEDHKVLGIRINTHSRETLKLLLSLTNKSRHKPSTSSQQRSPALRYSNYETKTSRLILNEHSPSCEARLKIFSSPESYYWMRDASALELWNWKLCDIVFLYDPVKNADFFIGMYNV